MTIKYFCTGCNEEFEELPTKQFYDNGIWYVSDNIGCKSGHGRDSVRPIQEKVN